MTSMPTAPKFARTRLTSSMWMALVSGLLITAFASCAHEPEVPESPAAARIGSRTISVADLDNQIKEDLFESNYPASREGRLYDARIAALDAIVADELVENAAAAEGVEPDEWAALVVERDDPVSNEEVQAFFDEHADRMPPGSDMVKMEENIRRYLGQQRVRDRIQALRADADVTVLLTRRREEVAAIGASRGPDSAPITIIEFSDFECPYCKRAIPTIDEVMAQYPEQVRIVYRHLPIPSHPRAFAASVASVCAEFQGRFWEYHDLLFENQRALSDDDLFAYAEQLELDADAFSQCVQSDAAAARVEADIEDASALEVTGTPIFFVNGLRLHGAQPLERFQSVIDTELAELATQ